MHTECESEMGKLKFEHMLEDEKKGLYPKCEDDNTKLSITVDLNNLGYTNKPFVLANDVAQVFYVKDMSTKPRKRKDKEANISYDESNRHIIFLGKRDIMGVEGKTDMSRYYENFLEISLFKVKAHPSTLLSDEDYPWLRPISKGHT